ncbi:lipopolysaccharide assembly protein LapB [uncultured Piscinibacter sp.]|uniref:lipopolysaccharide assembly protein LapB n=1 Tax=uncultured Piscinibacter sp. TaxID=1131835 RepID=UPI00261DA9C4|nr:lipopolysaccharide assembly protein LapB [uncultured Piscinibacter sp.]
MDFDLQWLLLGLPLAFAIGWLASRFDLRQWRREQKDSPRAYYQGLNLLLNEQHDKAIDAFIEAVQHDPDTSDLHFALGNLFRRRGEYERAVRVHEHLLNRADLPASERERAQHALAQDFMKAGLFDRAEQAFRALDGTVFDTEARLALLALHERSRDWRAAAEVAGKLERSGSGSFATRIANHWCELALEADARHQAAEADEALKRAHETAPQAARPIIMAGQRARARGDHREALQQWGALMATHPAAFNLVAADYAESARALGETAAALERLEMLYRREPTTDLLAALGRIDGDAQRARRRLVSHLQRQPALTAAASLLEAANDTPLAGDEMQALRDTVTRAAKPLQRYRCAACAFEAQHYFWQCPGCLGWDTYPPQRQEDL